MRHVCPVCQYEMVGERDPETKALINTFRYVCEQITSAHAELTKAENMLDGVLEATQDAP